MSNTNTGGPAFPTPTSNWINDGMTLRDYFAAKAMQAMLTTVVLSGKIPETIYVASYKIADGMLKTREQ